MEPHYLEGEVFGRNSNSGEHVSPESRHDQAKNFSSTWDRKSLAFANSKSNG